MIACIGSPMIDITTNVDSVFLQKYHLIPDSTTRLNETTKNLFEELETLQPTKTPGGSVTNTARIIRQIGGETVVYIGAIGDDPQGVFLLKTLTKDGVNCAFKISNKTTAKCAVLINGKTRTLCTSLGASKMFTAHHLREAKIREKLEDCRFVYFSALFLSVSKDCVEEVLRLKDKKLAFNLGAPFLCEKHPKEVLDVVSKVDVVFGNEAEFEALARLFKIEEDDPKKTLLRTNAWNNSNGRIMVVTRGERSVFLAHDGHVEEFPVIDVGDVVDTNGAGDAFVGGFLVKYMKQRPLQECIDCALWAASEVIQKTGCSLQNNSLYTKVK